MRRRISSRGSPPPGKGEPGPDQAAPLPRAKLGDHPSGTCAGPPPFMTRPKVPGALARDAKSAEAVAEFRLNDEQRKRLVVQERH